MISVHGRCSTPFFPVVDVDPRLPVYEDIVRVMAPSGRPLVFQRSAAMIALTRGKTIERDGVSLLLKAGGFRTEPLSLSQCHDWLG